MQSTDEATRASPSEWSIARLLLVMLALLAAIYGFLGIRQTLIPVGNGLLNASGHVLGNDFLFFYTGSTLVLSGTPSVVFDQETFFDLQSAIAGRRIKFPWAYPPHFLLYVAPLALVSYVPAMFAWIGVTLAPFVVLVRKLTGVPILAVLIMPPVVQNAISGQNGALSASLVAGGIAALAANRGFLGGLLLGCLVYKPQIFVLVPFCVLATRDLRVFAGLAITGLGIPLLGLAFFGLDAWRMFIEHLPRQLAYEMSGLLTRERLPTTFIFLFSNTGSETIARVGQIISMLCAWGLVYWCWRRTCDIFVRTLAFGVAMPLSTPYLYEYDLVLWSLPASFLAMRLWRGEGKPTDWIALVVLLWLPPFIWFSSNFGFSLSFLGVLALMPFLAMAARGAPLAIQNWPTLPIFNPPSTRA